MPLRAPWDDGLRRFVSVLAGRPGITAAVRAVWLGAAMRKKRIDLDELREDISRRWVDQKRAEMWALAEKKRRRSERKHRRKLRARQWRELPSRLPDFGGRRVWKDESGDR